MAVTIPDAKALVIELCRTYPVAAQLSYAVRNTVAELYGSDAAKGLDGVRGGYTTGPDIHPGRCDIVCSMAADADDLMTTLRHEVIGHFGLNTFTSDDKRALLKSISATRGELSMRRLWAAIDRDYAGQPESIKAEEVFALQCEGVQAAQHVNQAGVHERGEQAFRETCVERTRPMRRDDLESITLMVAHGLHDRTRVQRNFPEKNQQFMQERTMEPKRPFHEVVAERLIEQLKAGIAPWQRPWEPGQPGAFIPMNPTTGKRYKGINAIHLMGQGRTDPRWLTYKQAAAVDAQVRRGEKGTPIQYWKFTEEQAKTDEQGRPVLDAKGQPVMEEVTLERPRVFFATVFNAGQIDGLPPLQRKEQTWNAVERAEHILQASGAAIHHGEHNRAFYRPATDSIHLPDKSQFPSADNYYATALHELGHWAGHPQRLDRDLAHPFGSEGYAKEELRAEIASMILGDELGIGHDPGQHAAYVGSWIKTLQDDPLEIFRAASEAEKIQEYVLAFEQKQVQEQTEQQAVSAEQEATMQQQPEAAQVQQAAPAQSVPGNVAAEKVWLDLPYKQKEAAKHAAGNLADGKCSIDWDKQEKRWYARPGADLDKIKQWLPGQEAKATNLATEKTWLAVTFEQREAVKALAGKLPNGDKAVDWDKVAKCWYANPGADLDKLKPWIATEAANRQRPALSPKEEFGETLRSMGCVVSGDHPIMDGKKHRIEVEGDKKGEKAGFYVGHLDGHPAGYIKNNRTGIELKWKSKGYSLDPEQKVAMQAEAAAKLAARAEQQQREQERAAQRVGKQMADLVPIAASTPYLEAKGITLQAGVYTDRDGQKTYIPAIDADGKQWTMQYIQEDGTKRFAKESRKEGCFHPIGGLDAIAAAPAIVIGEGYATAAQVSQALGYGTVAAFDSGNLEAVAKALHEKYPDKPIVIAGDDDQAVQNNPGKTKAKEAARAVGGTAFFPIFAPGEQAGNPKGFTDFNDLAMKSALGVEGVDRQVQAAVGKAIEKHQTRAEQQALQQEQRHELKQERQPRAARIG